ncbi:MAG: PAS domain S-box protein, partial [Syntrophorhabdaceae bacterium]|nr:PAS domain S-box protein [Syntrophorhabdaceae bacterium]
GKITFWNHGAEERYGWTKKEAEGKISHTLLKTEFPKPLEEINDEVLRKGRWDGELIHTRKDGTKIIVNSRWVVRWGKDNKPMAIMEINNDITEKKRAEEALQRAKDELEIRVLERTGELIQANDRLTAELTRRKRIEEMLWKAAERYKNLFENSPIGIYRVAPDGRILIANPALKKMLGWDMLDEKTKGKLKNIDYEPTYLKKKFRNRLEKEGRIRGYEACWKLKNGTEIFVRENAKAIKGADGKTLYYEGTVEDITEQKKAEEKILLYQSQLRCLASDLSLAEERERRRIATMLHDYIGQLLAVSKIKLGALIESSNSDPIKKQLEKVRQHIEQAITHTRTLTFELSPPVLYDLGLKAAIEWLIEQIQKQYKIEFEFEDDGQSKEVAEDIKIFLFTAVRELLINVIKHAHAKKVKITLRKVNSNISLHVADDGVGFNVSKMKFYMDENKGFGLFSIRERLSHLGGHMEIRSQRGRGTRIILMAPLKNEIDKIKKHP